jgi:tetratricopeptide (TPR) repeat protein
VNIQKDFFISYNKADRQWAEWIAWTLEESGYSVVIQAWDFRPGGNFVLEMQRATVEAQKTIAVLSEDYLKSAFTQPEWAAAFAQDPQGQKGTLIPVRVQPCKLTGLLASIIYVDLLNLEAEAAQETLLQALLERVKPLKKPQFPGSVDRVIATQAIFPGQSNIPQNLPRSGVVEFVGRDPKLEELHTQLQQNARIAITAIAGMGGIGKTELALQYAISQIKQSHYPAGLCWLRARDQEIATQIVTFAQAHLGLTPPEQLEIDTQVRFCWQQWPEGEALVILDDVTDYKAIEPYLPPPDPRFKLLITTRLKLGRSVEEFPVEELDEDSAIALLESLAGRDRIQSQLVDAKALCTWVGSLPLALELLGRFLARKPDWTINRLLKALDDKRLDANALIAPESGMTAKLGIAAALELSWQELNEAEQELACVLGMFAIAPIPWLLVEQCLAKVEPDELEDTRDNGLIARSLLKWVGKGSYQLHQIVQEYFRIKLERRSDQGQEIKSSFCRVILAIFKTIDDTPTVELIERVRSTIIHLEEVASRWLYSLTLRDLTEPFVRIGRFYVGQGNYALAEPWYRECLEVTKKLLGQEHLFVAVSLNNLALLYDKQGRYKEAEPLFLQSLQIKQKLLGQEHPVISSSLNNLALLYDKQGRYEEAEPLFLQALQMRQNLLGQEHSDIASSLLGLALLYANQGRYEEAEPLYLQVLQMNQRLLGQEHPNVATSFNNLASLYFNQERYEEAESLYLQALQMRQKLLGQEHPDVAESINNLGALYYEQERYEEAEPLYLQALQLFQQFLGQEHPDVAGSVNNLASLYANQRRYEEAETLFLKVLQMRRKLFGQEHPDISSSLSSLGSLYYDQQRYQEAELPYLQALQMRQKLLGREHPDVAISLHNLGTLYQKQCNYSEARDLYNQAISIAQASLGPNHPNTKTMIAWRNSLPE